MPDELDISGWSEAEVYNRIEAGATNRSPCDSYAVLISQPSLRLLAVVLGLLSASACRAPEPPADRPGPAPAASVEAAPANERAVAEPTCPTFAVLSYGLPDDAEVDGLRPVPEGLPLSLYIQAVDGSGAPIYSLRPLLDRVAEADWLDSAEPEDWQDLDMDYSVTVSPGYRLDGACDRLVVENVVEGRSVEVFPIPYGVGSALALVDSLGRDMGTLTAIAAQPPTAERPSLSQPAPPPLRVDGTALVSTNAPGRIRLSRILPFGRWYARPAGVQYHRSDLVLVNVCDPYSAADQFCGLESDGNRPLADPPAPLVTTVGVTARDGGASVDVDVVEDASQASRFPGAPLWQAGTLSFPLAAD